MSLQGYLPQCALKSLSTTTSPIIHTSPVYNSLALFLQCISPTLSKDFIAIWLESTLCVMRMQLWFTCFWLPFICEILLSSLNGFFISLHLLLFALSPSHFYFFPHVIALLVCASDHWWHKFDGAFCQKWAMRDRAMDCNFTTELYFLATVIS